MTWAAEYAAKAQAVSVLSDSSDENDSDDGSADEDTRIQVFGLPPIPYAESSPELAALRTRAYRYAWSKCERTLQAVLQRTYDDTIKHIESFVRSSATAAASKQYDKGLPTGLVIGSSQSLLGPLQERFSHSTQPEDRDSPSSGIILASLTSTDCPNKKAACRSIIQALIRAGNERDNFETPKKANRKLSLMASDDMDSLQAWYNARFDKLEPTKRPRLVVYLQDFEAFDPAALSDLLYVMSRHRHCLPFVLLFAIATSVEAVHTLLSRSSSELLRTVVFQLAQNDVAFDNLIQGTFFGSEHQALSPGRRALSTIRSSFRCSDFSTDAVVSKLQHLYLSHFMSNPMSIYTVPVQDLNLDDNEFASVEAFLLTQAPMLRVLPSFRQHIRQIAETSESSPSRNGRRKAAANMLSSDASLLQAVRGARLERSSRLRSFRDGRKLFTILQDLQMTSAMDDRHMLRYYIKGQLLRHTRKACDNVRRTTEDKCSAFLDATCTAYESAQESVPCNIKAYAARMQQIRETAERQSGRSNFVNGHILGSQPQSSGDRDFTALMGEISAALSAYFMEAFRPPSDTIFHEIWQFDFERSIYSAFHPPTTTHLQAALRTPTSRIPRHALDEEPKLEFGDIDMCHMYRLLAEAGKMVNLSDWYDAWTIASANKIGTTDVAPTHTSKTSRAPQKRGKTARLAKRSAKKRVDASEDEDTPSDEEEDHVEHTLRHREARFVSALGDLAFIGYIQPTKRKDEHIARIVF